MRTAIEVERDGVTPARVYHSAGKGGIYAWTHAPDKATRARCDACQRGTIPKSVIESSRPRKGGVDGRAGVY